MLRGNHEPRFPPLCPLRFETAFQAEMGVDIRPLRNSRYPCSHSACCVAVRRMAAHSRHAGILPRFSRSLSSGRAIARTRVRWNASRSPASIGRCRARASRGVGQEQRLTMSVCVQRPGRPAAAARCWMRCPSVPPLRSQEPLYCGVLGGEGSAPLRSPTCGRIQGESDINTGFLPCVGHNHAEGHWGADLGLRSSPRRARSTIGRLSGPTSSFPSFSSRSCSASCLQRPRIRLRRIARAAGCRSSSGCR